MNSELSLGASRGHQRAGKLAASEQRRSVTKFERIRLVRRLGLNTQDDILVTSEEDWQRYSGWLKRFKQYTVRSFHEGPSRGTEPYFPVINRGDFAKHRRDLLSKGWKLIVAAPVDPKDAALAGTILRHGLVTEIDIVRGPGSVVRQVTHEGRIDNRLVVRGEALTGDRFVDEALRMVREMERRWPSLEALKRVIYEFSYYRTKVGYKREHVIFWEITGYDRIPDPGFDLEDLESIAAL